MGIVARAAADALRAREATIEQLRYARAAALRHSHAREMLDESIDAVRRGGALLKFKQLPALRSSLRGGRIVAESRWVAVCPVAALGHATTRMFAKGEVLAWRESSKHGFAKALPLDDIESVVLGLRSPMLVQFAAAAHATGHEPPDARCCFTVNLCRNGIQFEADGGRAKVQVEGASYNFAAPTIEAAADWVVALRVLAARARGEPLVDERALLLVKLQRAGIVLSEYAAHAGISPLDALDHYCSLAREEVTPEDIEDEMQQRRARLLGLASPGEGQPDAMDAASSHGNGTLYEVDHEEEDDEDEEEESAEEHSGGGDHDHDSDASGPIFAVAPQTAPSARRVLPTDSDGPIFAARPTVGPVVGRGVPVVDRGSTSAASVDRSTVDNAVHTAQNSYESGAAPIKASSRRLVRPDQHDSDDDDHEVAPASTRTAPAPASSSLSIGRTFATTVSSLFSRNKHASGVAGTKRAADVAPVASVATTAPPVPAQSAVKAAAPPQLVVPANRDRAALLGVARAPTEYVPPGTYAEARAKRLAAGTTTAAAVAQSVPPPSASATSHPGENDDDSDDDTQPANGALPAATTPRPGTRTGVVASSARLAAASVNDDDGPIFAAVRAAPLSSVATQLQPPASKSVGASFAGGSGTTPAVVETVARSTPSVRTVNGDNKIAVVSPPPQRTTAANARLFTSQNARAIREPSDEHADEDDSRDATDEEDEDEEMDDDQSRDEEDDDKGATNVLPVSRSGVAAQQTARGVESASQSKRVGAASLLTSSAPAPAPVARVTAPPGRVSSNSGSHGRGGGAHDGYDDESCGEDSDSSGPKKQRAQDIAAERAALFARVPKAAPAAIGASNRVTLDRGKSQGTGGAPASVASLPPRAPVVAPTATQGGGRATLPASASVRSGAAIDARQARADRVSASAGSDGTAFTARSAVGLAVDDNVMEEDDDVASMITDVEGYATAVDRLIPSARPHPSTVSAQPLDAAAVNARLGDKKREQLRGSNAAPSTPAARIVRPAARSAYDDDDDDADEHVDQEQVEALPSPPDLSYSAAAKSRFAPRRAAQAPAPAPAVVRAATGAHGATRAAATPHRRTSTNTGGNSEDDDVAPSGRAAVGLTRSTPTAAAGGPPAAATTRSQRSAVPPPPPDSDDDSGDERWGILGTAAPRTNDSQRPEASVASSGSGHATPVVAAGSAQRSRMSKFR